MPAKDLSLMILSSWLWPIHSVRLILTCMMSLVNLSSIKHVEGIQRFFDQNISRLGMVLICRKTLTLTCQWAENTSLLVVMMSNYITSLSACHRVVAMGK